MKRLGLAIGSIAIVMGALSCSTPTRTANTAPVTKAVEKGVDISRAAMDSWNARSTLPGPEPVATPVPDWLREAGPPVKKLPTKRSPHVAKVSRDEALAKAKASWTRFAPADARVELAILTTAIDVQTGMFDDGSKIGVALSGDVRANDPIWLVRIAGPIPDGAGKRRKSLTYYLDANRGAIMSGFFGSVLE